MGKNHASQYANFGSLRLKSFLNGDTLQIAKEKMITTYDAQIAALDTTDPMAAVELVHNKEALVFDGNDDLLFSDLQ